jgi:heme/copper-type cytochrome/quinol oxidase subunit 2
MNPFQALIYLLFVLPAFMAKEGWKMFKKGMTERDWWWKLPYVLLIILVILLIVLLLNGYR